MKLYKLTVRPILEYGAQVLTYQKYLLKSSIDIPKCLNKLTVFEEKLEHLQTQALKNLIGCPKSTSPAIGNCTPFLRGWTIKKQIGYVEATVLLETDSFEWSESYLSCF